MQLIIVFTPACTEWYWKVWFRDWVYLVVAVILALLSVIIVWSESTFGIPIGGENNYLSVCSTVVYHGHSRNNYAIVEVR